MYAKLTPEINNVSTVDEGETKAPYHIIDGESYI